jgi:staphylococcal nuclease domain-containing protein 1
MWKDYDEEKEKAEEAAAAAVDDTSAMKTEYMDVIISDIRPQAALTFSVQILNTEGTVPRAPCCRCPLTLPQGSRRWRS